MGPRWSHGVTDGVTYRTDTPGMDDRKHQELQYQSVLEAAVLWFRKALDALSTTPRGLAEFADEGERERAQDEAAGSALREARKNVSNAVSIATILGQDPRDLDGVLVTEMFRATSTGYQPMDADRY